MVSTNEFISEIKKVSSFTLQKHSNEVALNEAKFYAEKAKDYSSDLKENDLFILDKVLSAKSINQVRNIFN